MHIDPQLLSQLRDRTVGLDQSGAWPIEQFQWLADAGILGWVIPLQHGGSDISQEELVRGYEGLSAACLTTAFILTQRNGACQRLAGCDNEQLKRELLPRFASGELFATVGISHLTTSRQHIHTPAVVAELIGDEIRLSGSIPWVTGAAHADYIVTGGTCSDGRQVLLALPTGVSGVTIQPHAKLMALTASHTASVELHDVVIPRSYLLAGPIQEVMKQGLGGGTGSQVTSTLAIGLASRAATLIEEQARFRGDLQAVSDLFLQEVNGLRADLYRSVSETPADHEMLPSIPPTAAEIRQRANSLVLRITQAAMAVSKGAGYVQGHPSELAVREAMFFLVWSCPQPVVQGVLRELACADGEQ